ncbi:MAG: glycoside hydrolase family 2 protein [Clostridia bacterium]|nr:glycoside hydrolase family 2 protein [Clostridia bacterium]
MLLNLDGTWLMGKPGQDKIEAKVPGSVYENLLNAGLIEDPFWRDNEELAYKICDDDYSFSRSIEISGELLSHDDITLVCEGLDTLADVYLNGALLGHTENMHRTYEFPVKGLLHEGQNRIEIVLYSPNKYADEMEMRRPIWGVNTTLPGFQHLRKGHYMFGWDWGPILPDMGIWRSIGLRFLSGARIKEVYFRQKHFSGQVELQCEITAQLYAEKPLRARVEIMHPDGRHQELYGEFENAKAVLKANIQNPELWWPNGYGQQPLYDVRVTLISEDSPADSRDYQIGLRTIKLSTYKDQWGREFTFVVNGEKIFAMGANYIPQDNLLGRVTYQRTENLVRDCVAANFNMLRIWGGGLYADDDLLSLCDRYGILVWQDFLFACALYDLTDAFEENIKKEAEDNIKRMRHHACLALWCGNNENETALVHWGLPQNEKLRSDYLTMYERILPEVVKTHDPDRYYWPSSPSSYGGFDKPGDPDHGDTHYWDVWHGMKPFEDYKNHYFRFCSEFGFQSFPSMKTIESFTLPEDRNIFSYVMERHQKNTAANGKIVTYLADNYRFPKDLRQLIYASQLLQSEAVGVGVEHMRRNRGRCMGATYWQVNDCWPVASWSSIDYFGRWKALHYAAKRFFAPVLLSAERTDKVVKLNVSNERRTRFEGQVIWALHTHAGEKLREGSVSVSIPKLSAQYVTEMSFENELKEPKSGHKIYLEFRLVENDAVLSEGTLLFVKPKHFDFLNPEITCTIEETLKAFKLLFEAKAFAKSIELVLKDRDVKFSDNYFDLSPGGMKEVTLDKAQLKDDLKLSELEELLEINSVYHMA